MTKKTDSFTRFVKGDDNPTFATTGYVIVHLMDKIRKQHLNN